MGVGYDTDNEDGVLNLYVVLNPATMVKQLTGHSLRNQHQLFQLLHRCYETNLNQISRRLIGYLQGERAKMSYRNLANRLLKMDRRRGVFYYPIQQSVVVGDQCINIVSGGIKKLTGLDRLPAGGIVEDPYDLTAGLISQFAGKTLFIMSYKKGVVFYHQQVSIGIKIRLVHDHDTYLRWIRRKTRPERLIITSEYMESVYRVRCYEEYRISPQTSLEQARILAISDTDKKTVLMSEVEWDRIVVDEAFQTVMDNSSDLKQEIHQFKTRARFIIIDRIDESNLSKYMNMLAKDKIQFPVVRPSGKQADLSQMFLVGNPKTRYKEVTRMKRYVLPSQSESFMYIEWIRNLSSQKSGQNLIEAYTTFLEQLDRTCFEQTNSMETTCDICVREQFSGVKTGCCQAGSICLECYLKLDRCPFCRRERSHPKQINEWPSKLSLIPKQKPTGRSRIVVYSSAPNMYTDYGTVVNEFTEEALKDYFRAKCLIVHPRYHHLVRNLSGITRIIFADPTFLLLIPRSKEHMYYGYDYLIGQSSVSVTYWGWDQTIESRILDKILID